MLFSAVGSLQLLLQHFTSTDEMRTVLRVSFGSEGIRLLWLPVLQRIYTFLHCSPLPTRERCLLLRRFGHLYEALEMYGPIEVKVQTSLQGLITQ